MTPSPSDADIISRSSLRCRQISGRRRDTYPIRKGAKKGGGEAGDKLSRESAYDTHLASFRSSTSIGPVLLLLRVKGGRNSIQKGLKKGLYDTHVVSFRPISSIGTIFALFITLHRRHVASFRPISSMRRIFGQFYSCLE